MSKNVVPMIHVPDVCATVDWYQSIGFHVVATYGNESARPSRAMLHERPCGIPHFYRPHEDSSPLP